MTLEKGFFTHLMTPGGVERGLEAIHYPSFEAAYLEVIASIPEIAADMLRRGWDPMECAFLICDENDQLVEAVHFRELVKPRTESRASNARDLFLPIHGWIIRDLARSTYAQSQLTKQASRELLHRSQALDRRIASLPWG